jgi:hypothetical protein
MGIAYTQRAETDQRPRGGVALMETAEPRLSAVNCDRLMRAGDGQRLAEEYFAQVVLQQE